MTTIGKTIQSTDQSALAAALLDPAVYGGTAESVEKLETHISYIFLAGSYAYKVKKAVDLGFLDFSSLSQRHFFCQEELRLNRRLAPAIYLDVIPITGSHEHPQVGGAGAPIEYAVKMRRFAQNELLDALLAHRKLTHHHIDRLAEKIAAFHASASVTANRDPYGSPSAIRQPALENFSQMRSMTGRVLNPKGLDELEQWTTRQCDALDGIFRARKASGFVRECHGDFHLGNVALVDNDVTIFDCLEFNANLRWIDVMSEVAFLVMDLHDKKRPDLGQRFLNRYLEITGDYDGLAVLRFYMVYRAMVRAKVHGLRAGQAHVNAQQKTAALNEYRNYVALAKRQIGNIAAAIIITHGLSGSGKTTHSTTLLETTAAVRIRSDIERKRLQGLSALARSGSKLHDDLYSPDVTALTYRRLADLAKTIVKAGYVVVVDATFLERRRRDAFRQLATSLRVPFLILDFVAPLASLRLRVAERQQQRSEASEADIGVLEHQLQTQEPLQPDELLAAIRFNATQTPSPAAWNPVLGALGFRLA